jgi:hypothetical protein
MDDSRHVNSFDSQEVFHAVELKGHLPHPDENAEYTVTDPK